MLFEGVIATALLIYLFAAGTAGALTLDFSPVAGGLLLLRGDLAAASWLRTIAFASLAAFPCVIVACCFLQTMDLTRVEILLNPATAAAVMLVSTVVVLSWVIKEIGRDEVRTAMHEASLKQHAKANAIASGIALVVFVCIFIGIARGDKSPGIVVALAEQRLGSGFPYHLGSVSKVADGDRELDSKTVTAWNEKEIRTIPPTWEERR